MYSEKFNIKIIYFLQKCFSNVVLNEIFTKTNYSSLKWKDITDIFRLSSCNASSVSKSNYQKRLKVEENARCENPAKQEKGQWMMDSKDCLVHLHTIQLYSIPI